MIHIMSKHISTLTVVFILVMNKSNFMRPLEDVAIIIFIDVTAHQFHIGDDNPEHSTIFH